MVYQDYLLNTVFIIAVSVVFKQYVAPYLVPDEKYLVNKFLYNDNYSTVKPYLWIYVPLEENSREWDTFNERKTKKINIPYVEYCMKTILVKNKGLFNICVVTDNDVGELIPDWKFRINELSEPIKNRVRRLAKLKLLYHYGGLVVPMSCLCLRSLRSLYVEAKAGAFMVECDKSESVIGSRKGERSILEHMNNIELYVKDMSNETEFNDFINSSAKKSITMLDRRLFGLESKEKEDIDLKDLLGQGGLELDDSKYCVYFPYDKILQSKMYGWFAKVKVEEIKYSNMEIAKYFKQME